MPLIAASTICSVQNRKMQTAMATTVLSGADPVAAQVLEDEGQEFHRRIP